MQTREPNAQIEQVVDLWGRQLDAVESQDFAKVDTEIDWVIKRKLFQRYQDRYDMELRRPQDRPARPRLPRHQAWSAACSTCCSARASRTHHHRRGDRGRGQRRRRRPRAPKLRGEFISAAQAAGRDFTVDWVHLKLNDQAQRTVLCKDPFRSVDERVKRLITSM